MFAIPLLEQIRVLLATLVEMKIRFIFAQGICSDEIVAEVKRQCELSDNRGLLVGWMPQNGTSHIHTLSISPLNIATIF